MGPVTIFSSFAAMAVQFNNNRSDAQQCPGAMHTLRARRQRSAHYERASIILTSNQGFGEWGELLGDSVIASVVLDRLLRHSHVLNIRGVRPPAELAANRSD